MIDELKYEYNFFGTNKKYTGFFFEFISNEILKNSKIINKPHPKYSKEVYSKRPTYIRGVIGYTSMYLINNLWSDIPFFSVAKNQNSSYSLLKSNNIKKISIKELKKNIIFSKKKNSKKYTSSYVIDDIIKKLKLL